MESNSDPYAMWNETDLKAELERLQAALTHLHNNTAATQLLTKQIGQVKEQLFASKRPGQRLDMAEKTARQATTAVQKAQEAIAEHEKKTQMLQSKLQEAQRLEQEAQQKLAAVKAAVAEAATTAQAEAAPDLTETSANLIKAFIPQGVNATVQDQRTIVMNQALAQMQSQVNLIVQTASAAPPAQASQSVLESLPPTQPVAPAQAVMPQQVPQQVPQPVETIRATATFSQTPTDPGNNPLADPWDGQ